MSQSANLAILDIERLLSASREEVFAALTETEQMNQWFFGMPEGRAEVEQDFKVGGAYVIKMFAADGIEHTCENAEYAPHGTFLEIDPPSKLVYTWVSEGFVEDSTVTITLEEENGGGTLLKLRHELPAEIVEPHRDGWTTCINHLASYLDS